ncbi:hypothetical protein Tco_0911275, partial [Tanacetum coccineum]
PPVDLYHLEGSNKGDNKIDSLTKEPLDILLMGDEVISTTPERENDEFIKSSVDDLVPIPRESEVTSVYDDLEYINLPLGEHLDTLSIGDREVDFNPSRDIEELERLLADDPVLLPRVFDEPLVAWTPPESTPVIDESTLLVTPLPASKQLSLREVERFDHFFSLTQSGGRTRVMEIHSFGFHHMSSPRPAAYSPKVDPSNREDLRACFQSSNLSVSDIFHNIMEILNPDHISSGESKVHIEVLSVLWRNRLPIPDGSLPLSSLLHSGLPSGSLPMLQPSKKVGGKLPRSRIKTTGSCREYYAKIIEKFDKILKERYELVQTLTDRSSKDEDSYNDGDQDNDSNNNDDDGAPMADGNKQNENDIEKENGNKKEKENKDDIGKGRKEGGSEPKDDGEEVYAKVNNEHEFEKLTEKDDKAAVSMEVDDINEQMKEKEADKEKKEQQAKTKKEKQAEADKDKEFTDEQYEQLMTQAAEDHKNMTSMTRSKRKSIEDMIPPDFVFETNDGAASIRDNMQTLAPQLKVDANVIDSLSSVLNHEEKTLDMFKWKNKDGKYDEDKQYEAFSKTIESESQKDAELKEMKDLEMRKLFSRYLEELKHPKAKDLLSKKPTILRLKWGTKNNDTVCEVFLMMHMQYYKGENPKQWNLPFLKEDEGNTMDIIKMRVSNQQKQRRAVIAKSLERHMMLKLESEWSGVVATPFYWEAVRGTSENPSGVALSLGLPSR